MDHNTSTDERPWPPVPPAVIAAAVTVVLAVGIRSMRELAAPILMGLVVAVGASPLIGALMKKRVPALVAYLLTLVVIVVATLGVLSVLSFMIYQMTDILPQLQDQLSALQEDSVDLLARWGIDASRLMQDQVLSPENLVVGATVVLNALYNALKGVALIVVIAAFLLVEAPGFRVRLYAALGEDRPAMRRWLRWAQDTRSYLLITTVMAGIVAVLNFFLLLALGVPYPYTWAVLSFIMSYVPNVGFFISLAPPVLLLVVGQRWGLAAGVLGGYFVINVATDFVLRPRLLKNGVDLPLSISFLSLLVWGYLLGPIGALLAVPMTMLVRAAFLEADESTEQLAVLFRSDTAPRRHVRKNSAHWWSRRPKAAEEAQTPADGPNGEGETAADDGTSAAGATPTARSVD